MSWKRWLLAAAMLAAACYVGLVAYLTLNQSRYFYYPDPRRPDPARLGLVGVTPVELRSGDGQRILGWWSPPRPGEGVVLYLHGNGGNLGGRARRFADIAATGAGVLAIDYRGYGGSEGSPSELGLYDDARTAWQFAHRQAPGSPIAIFGESLGTGVAVQLATEVNEAAVMLDSPFSSFAGVTSRRVPWYPTPLIRERYDSRRKISRIGSPLLIVHCDADQVIPFAEGQRLFGQARAPKAFMPLRGCGHTQIWSGDSRKRILAFLVQHLRDQAKTEP